MVVSAAEVARALEQQRAEPPPAEEHALDLTVQHPAVVAAATPDGKETDVDSEAEPDGEGVEKASPLRVVLALLVIVLLAGAIVLLVLNALPR
jgi:hypothetical protein